MKAESLYNKALHIANQVLLINYGLSWNDLTDSNDMMDYIYELDENEAGLSKEIHMDELLQTVMDAVIDRVGNQLNKKAVLTSYEIFEKPYLKEYLKLNYTLN